MPENWKTYKLSEAFEIIGGGTPKTKFKEYWDGNIPWLSVVDFNNDQRTVFSTEKSITELGLKKSSTKILVKGQLIISARGTVGQIAQLGRDMAFNQSCYGLSGKENVLINDFGYYLLKSSITNIQANSHGSVFDTITRNTFDNIEARIPEIEEQRAIASILSALDDKIELNLQMNKTLEEMATALYKHWFVDFGPFREGKFLDSELGMIPEGWEVKRLDEIAVKKSETFNFKNIEEVVFVNTGDVQEGRFLHSNRSPKKGLPGQAKKAISKGDILYSEIRPKNKRYAYVNFDSENYVVSTKFMIINPSQKILSKLLYRILTMRSTVDNFNSIAEARSGTFPQITFDAIGDSKYVIAPIEIQKDFQSIVGPLELQQDELYLENQTLTSLRDTLLPKLISGEVRVKEAEKILTEAL